jgi:RecB family exonuclease
MADCALQRGRPYVRTLDQLPPASELPYDQIAFEGFLAPSAETCELAASMASRTCVTVELPESPAAGPARRRLAAAGFREERLPDPQPPAGRSLFAAPTPAWEAEEIARRILERAARGRKFREMGIVLRVRDPYTPLLATTLARFGIPARFSFPDPLASHPVTQYLCGVVRSMLPDGDWDLEALLRAVRMPVSGIGATPQGDRLDFEWRAGLPAAGPPSGELLTRLTALDPLRREQLTPGEWAARLRILRGLVPPPRPGESLDREQLTFIRSTSLALEAFGEALDAASEAAAARHGGGGRFPLSAFWPEAERVLARTPFQIADRRREVLHVMDVPEARYRRPAVVFLCGLIERHFPQHYHEDPLPGGPEQTTADRQRMEPFLFRFAQASATEELILSYPRVDERGGETVPALFLDPSVPVELCQSRVAPRPRFPAPVAAAGPKIQGTEGKTRLARRHAELSPTGIESFLQCPFQFFASRTLRLHPRPLEPRQRLNPLFQGAVMHRAVAEWKQAPALGVAALDRVFEEECARFRVPPSYRKETVRLQLRRDFEAFLTSGDLPLAGWSAAVEQSFRFPLGPDLAIRGRIDRLERSPRGEAVVIDYKYSAGDAVRERVEASAAGTQVQAGLYLAAAEPSFGMAPAGVLFCALKREVTWDGWHAPIPGLEATGEACTPEVLRERTRAAVESARRAHQAILDGDIAVRPADRDRCWWCEFRDVCRVETLESP